MPRGRPPKPTKLKLLTGNPGKRPLNASEPKPAAVVPKCPAWLDAEAKQKWKQVAPQLARLGLLTVVDGDALAAYCQAWAEFRQATEVLQQEGRVVRVGGLLAEDDDGQEAWIGYQLQPHPAVAQQRSAWQAIKSFAALFGLDPSSRSKLHVAGQEHDELAEFLPRGS
jgi:P27 family predicted phage terminase small subunit